MHARPCANIFVTRVRRHASTVRDVHGELVAESRSTARFSETCRRHPAVEAAGIDTADMTNFRPVSQVTFISKVVERAVTKQLEQYSI